MIFVTAFTAFLATTLLWSAAAMWYMPGREAKVQLDILDEVCRRLKTGEDVESIISDLTTKLWKELK